MMQHDVIITLRNSLVQHGPANDRVYLMKLDEDDLPGIVDDICELGKVNGYSKLFVRAPETGAGHFRERGFVDEACVPGMYRGSKAGCFLSRYLEPGRARYDSQTVQKLIDRFGTDGYERADPPVEHDIRRLGPVHAQELAGLYESVFDSYPFPITDPDFIQSEMSSDVLFFGVFSNDRLVAASSAETDVEWNCAEMTDFATLPECRGKGAATALLTTMEQSVSKLGIETAYTIARSNSIGMNSVFCHAGYSYAGTLPNNTNIAGSLESMNVWYKTIPAS